SGASAAGGGAVFRPGGGCFGAVASSRERGLRLLGDRAERGRVADREVGEYLPVELDPGLRAAVHELVVREAVRAGRRVDPGDPELPELALPHLPVAVGVDERVLDLLLGVTVVGAFTPPVALRLLEDLAALLVRVDGSLDPRHRSASSQHLLDRAAVAAGDLAILAEAALTLRRFLLQVVAPHRGPAQDLAAARHLELLPHGAPCLHFRHLVSLLRSSSALAASPCCVRPGGAGTRSARSP